MKLELSLGLFETLVSLATQVDDRLHGFSIQTK